MGEVPGVRHRETDFDEFYLATRGRLLGQLTAMTADPEQAADVLQEGYVRAWQAWPRVSQLQDPAAWVRKVSWRLAVSQYRRAVVLARIRTTLRGDDQKETSSTFETGLDIQAALQRLPAAQRHVLVLHELCGLSVQEVADESGVPEGTVKSRLFRARAAMASLLGPEYQVPEAPARAHRPGLHSVPKEEPR